MPGYTAYVSPVRGTRQLVLSVLLLVGAVAFSRQVKAQENDSAKPVPIFSAGTGIISTVNAGHTELSPVFNPVVLVPIGDRWLIESRAEFEGDFQRNSQGDFGGDVDKGVDYLQVDYLANRYLTVTVGRFLTPFGIYNERLYPVWIRNLQTTPLVFPVGTGSSDGAMARGGFQVRPDIILNYAAYFSTLSTLSKFESDRLAGWRSGIFLPNQRLEIGFSVQHLLQENHDNAFGFHFEWQPRSMPLDLRAEYARSHIGSGYWAESAYRLSGLPYGERLLQHTQVVARFQQFWPGSDKDAPGEYGTLASNTQEPDFGIDYLFTDGLKATASYGRQFSTPGNANIWTVGVAYRFALPLGGAR